MDTVKRVVRKKKGVVHAMVLPKGNPVFVVLENFLEEWVLADGRGVVRVPPQEHNCRSFRLLSLIRSCAKSRN